MTKLSDYLFYSEPGITLYCGDCREVLPLLDEPVDVIITDPVWPNSSPDLAGSADPVGLFSEATKLFRANRLVVQLGCDSDPRFLLSVPPQWPFLRICWLEYALPTNKGRVLYSGDVAYLFGRPPNPGPGRQLMPGKKMGAVPDPKNGHPTRRRIGHVRWLVAKFSDGLVLDPFMGSGPTVVSAKNCGYPAIGIEIEPKYCEIAVKRLRQEVLL